MGGVVFVDSRYRIMSLALVRVTEGHVDRVRCDQAFTATMIETNMLLTWLLAVVA